MSIDRIGDWLQTRSGRSVYPSIHAPRKSTSKT